MTETPSGGPLVSRPPRRRRKLFRSTTSIAEPTTDDLGEIQALVESLPADLRALAEHLALRRLWRIERALFHRTTSLAVLLHEIEDPHNQAAVLRTAEGLGIQRVHLVSRASASLRPSVGVTQNAHKWLDVIHHESSTDALSSCRGEGHRLVAAALTPDAIPAGELNWTLPTTLLLGNEVHGLPKDLLEACDNVVALPMYGLTVSYNLSVAAAMLLVGAVEARRQAWGYVGDLEGDEKMDLRRRFYRLALPGRVRQALGD